MVKWIACAVAIFIISTVTMQGWEWDGSTIVVQNIISSVLFHTLLSILSVGHLYLCFEISVWNGVFLMLIAKICQSLAFSLYKAVETMLIGETGAATPGVNSVLLNLALLVLGCLLLWRVFGSKTVYRFAAFDAKSKLLF